ncbi:MAG: signal peptide peptidase SppA [Bacteroidetes bacterium]|nr:signal peptide peptidase SppA [Bacteroidota bacterium]
MKSFWGSFLGTLVGVFVTFLFIFFVVIGIVVASISKFSAQSDNVIKVKQKSVLHITFDGPIPERSSKNPFENFSFGNFEYQPLSLGLNDILSNIEKAKDDPNISGIYLDISSIPAGIATLEEIRNALLDFKESPNGQAKKFVVAYSEGYAQGAYYLATVADTIYLNPEGMVDFKGLSTQMMFFKKLLDKLEVDVQIFRHGKFKSATEPYFLDKMSPASREQVLTYLHSIWNYTLEGIAKQRNISIEELNRYADNMLINNSESSLRYKLVDRLVYKDEMLEVLAQLTGQKSDKINYVDMHKYTHAPQLKKEPYTKNKIAVIYATGEINGGDGDDKTIGSEGISKAIREARLDENVKAIVLRVNSPGGGVVPSDVIWREMKLAKKEKPVVVSMGDVAASGGYYIACDADAIVAHPNTITGSIGVFGVFPNVQGLFANKFGITVDTAKTNQHSDFGNPYRALGKDEGAVVQKWIEDVYQDFIGKVADGRHMTKDEIDSIGQGRVWSGVDGKRIGLVDKFGGIKDAIALAAEKAKLKQYKILELPKQKDAFEEIMKNAFDGEVMMEKKLRAEFGDTYQNYKNLQSVLKYKGVQARLPYDIVIY